jgi:hypothetical protein
MAPVEYDNLNHSDKQLKQILDQKLIKTGEKDRLKEFLRQRLAESGWVKKL